MEVKVKKIIIFMQMLVLAVVLFSGCGTETDSSEKGPGHTSDTATDTQTDSTENTVYTVVITDQDKEAVQGCIVNFCDDSSCMAVVSDKHGTAQYSGAAYPYHIQVVKVPDGYSYDTSKEYIAEENGCKLDVTVVKD